MKSQHLNFFLAMAEHGSIRGAARALGLTQPAVTKTVRTLEKEIGLPLIQRSISGVVLTDHGHALLKHAQRINNEMRRADEAMAARKDGDGGVVRVAVSASAAITLIPTVLEDFTKLLPRARVSLIESSVKSALNGLFDGSLDLAVLQLGPGAFPPHIQTVQLFEIEQRIVVRKGHPHQQATSFSELIGCKWVVPQHPDWRGVFTSPFGRSRFCSRQHLSSVRLSQSRSLWSETLTSSASFPNPLFASQDWRQTSSQSMSSSRSLP
jgi:LysR family transcriptional regulator of abg operon